MDSQQVDAGLATRVRTAPRGGDSAWLDSVRRRRASAYHAGPRLNDALAACRRLAGDAIPVAVGYSAATGQSARATADVHLGAFEGLVAAGLDGYVSVKLSELAFDPALLGELDAAAARTQRRLHLDALAPDTVDATWRLLERMPRTGALGMSFPGRWRRSADDAARAAELGCAVRVVKGQWAHGAGGDVDPAEGFLRVVDRLCCHRGGVAVGTHDVALLTEAVRRLTTSGTPCEVELLYGLPFRAPAIAARRLGVAARLYLPFGDVGANYGITDLRRKPVTAWWLAQDLLLGKDKTWQSIRRSRARL
ncbi:MAG: proline dehydrogenase [Solirubrobacteraceae bacterium]